MNAVHYFTLPTTAGERTALMTGQEPFMTMHAVFVGPDHAQLAKRVAELLNANQPKEPPMNPIACPNCEAVMEDGADMPAFQMQPVAGR